MNEAVIETVQNLCQEGNRESVLTVFQNFPEHFSCIPLNDSNVESKQAINDLLRENVILNGVKFFSGHGELFLESLRQVVEILSQSPEYKGERTGSEIVDRVLCKASRTTSGSDSYFTVRQLFTNSDYLLKRRAERLPPINVEVFLVDNSIHSVVACANYYGLFNLEEIEAESQSFAVSPPQAWLRLDTMVVEKTDYLTGRNVRYLRVDTPDLPSSQQQHHHQEGGIAPGAGGAGSACTPPPRESGDSAFSNGGSGGGGGLSVERRSGHGGKKALPPGISQNGWAPPSVPAASHVGISPDRLFGETAASAT
ncbi:unnamed protein product [Scytosiphon promiscuus]